MAEVITEYDWNAPRHGIKVGVASSAAVGDSTGIGSNLPGTTAFVSPKVNYAQDFTTSSYKDIPKPGGTYKGLAGKGMSSKDVWGLGFQGVGLAASLYGMFGSSGSLAANKEAITASKQNRDIAANEAKVLGDLRASYTRNKVV